MREPDLYIGGKEDPYLMRWYLIPRNRFFNIYLHKIIRDDDDRALHDHPWWSFSICLKGKLAEVDKSGVRYIKRFGIRFRSAQYAHRLMCAKNFTYRNNFGIEVPYFETAWTLFITGPKIREWGFHCPNGWRHWSLFTDATGAKTGKGCE